MKTTFDYTSMAGRVGNWAKEYAAAKPFPHIVLDSLGREEAIRAALEAFPAPEDDRWFDTSGPEGTVQLKQTMWDSRKIPEPLCRVLLEMNSGPFVDFLEDLTGIEGLVPDPHYFGAGLHQILPGGTLGVHVDHNLNPRLNLYRRVSVVFYLNRDWVDDYQGHLELWSVDMAKCVKRISPNFGRMVVFTNSETSFHGHPQPLACLHGMTRKSLSAFYLSSVPDPSYSPEPHKALFRAEPGPTSS